MLKRFFPAVLVLLTLFGCAARVNVASNKDATYQNKIDRLLISISLNKTYLSASNVSQSFLAKLSARGVSVETLVRKPLELDSSEAMRAAIAKFKPTQVMELVATSTISDRYRLIAFTLESSIYDTKIAKRIWRSSINFKGSEGDPQKNADKFVDTVIEKLQADGLL